MATADERTALARLIGKHLPVGDAEAVAYTDDELDAYLALVPQCPYSNGSGGGVDVYGAAAAAWEDKALEADLAAIAVASAPLVKDVRQADASVTYARPTPLGTTVLAPNDPGAMRALAQRLRRRSCNGGRFRSVDVAPPNVVQPGPRDPFALDYDGADYIERQLILDPVENPDRVVNLPEVD